MVSKRILDLVDGICRYVRELDKPLGGLQAVFIGDFLQLSPVPSKDSDDDDGQYCFKHKEFQSMVPHVVQLVEVCFINKDTQVQTTHFVLLLHVYHITHLKHCCFLVEDKNLNKRKINAVSIKDNYTDNK